MEDVDFAAADVRRTPQQSEPMSAARRRGRARQRRRWGQGEEEHVSLVAGGAHLLMTNILVGIFAVRAPSWRHSRPRRAGRDEPGRLARLLQACVNSFGGSTSSSTTRIERVQQVAVEGGAEEGRHGSSTST